MVIMQVTRCDAVQTVEHQDTQLVYRQCVDVLAASEKHHEECQKCHQTSLSDDQSCRSIENSLELSQMNVACTCKYSIIVVNPAND